MATPKLVAEAERLGILPKTEYRREHYMFPRQQSEVSRLCDWEDRCARPEPWWRILLALGGYCALIYAAYLMLPFFSALMRALWA